MDGTVGVTGCDLPQWSPPLNGGVTKQGWGVIRPGDRPQWSPPLNGGVTCSGS